MDSSSTADIFSLKLSSHDPSKETIVFLHGFFCSHLEFANVTPFLKDYNLILVDLPGHSRSSSIPFSIDASVSHIKTIIETHTPRKKAHLVGLSAGGFVALAFGRVYPDLVLSVFASGATPFTPFQKWLSGHPWILYFFIGMLICCPDWMYWALCAQVGMVRHEELRAEMRANFTLDLTQRGYSEFGKITLDEVAGMTGVRSACIAAGSGDDVEGANKMATLLRSKNPRSKAFTIPNAVHGWDLQFPEVFGRGVAAWIEEQLMPEQYVELTDD